MLHTTLEEVQKRFGGTVLNELYLPFYSNFENIHKDTRTKRRDEKDLDKTTIKSKLKYAVFTQSAQPFWTLLISSSHSLVSSSASFSWKKENQNCFHVQPV